MSTKEKKAVVLVSGLGLVSPPATRASEPCVIMTLSERGLRILGQALARGLMSYNSLLCTIWSSVGVAAFGISEPQSARPAHGINYSPGPSQLHVL